MSVIANILVILTILGDILVVGLLAAFAAGRPLREKISEKALLFSFLVALIATSGSLFYSEILHYTPCLLCWYQRIFMYPQVFLLGLGLIKKDGRILDYSLLLSGVGLLISSYHYAIQLGLVSGACNVVGGAAISCSQRFVMEYGYVTIPMMALTAAALIFLLSLHARKMRSER